MAIEGTKISVLDVLDTSQVKNSSVLGYLDSIPKKNYQIRYVNIKEKIAEDIIDQSYDAQSSNAQSGIAVAEAFKEFSEVVASKEELEDVVNSINNINETLETKADIRRVDEIALDMDSIHGDVLSINERLEEHGEELENRITKDDAEKLREEINKETSNAIEGVEFNFNSKIDEVRNEVEEAKHTASSNLESTKKEIEDTINQLKEDINSGNIGGGGDIDEEKLQEYLQNYVTKDVYNNDVTFLQHDMASVIDSVGSFEETIKSKADSSYVENEVERIMKEIERVDNKEVEYDSYVSSYSENAVTSSAIYNYVNSQGFLKQPDIESLKPFEPAESSTQQGNIEKAVYWFLLDKKYINKGYITNVSIKTGTQPEKESNGDDDNEPNDDYNSYDESSYISLSINKVERDSSGSIIGFIQLAISNSYAEPLSDSWMSYEFENVAVTGEDEIAFVFVDSSAYNSDTQNPQAKVSSVVIASSSVLDDDSSVVYTDDGEEKLLVNGWIGYNKPIEMTGLNIIDTIHEGDYPNWENEEEYNEDNYVGYPRVTSPVAILRYVKEKISELLESGGIEITEEQLDYISQKVSYQIGTQIDGIESKVSGFEKDVEHILDGTFLSDKLDEITNTVKDRLSDEILKTGSEVAELQTRVQSVEESIKETDEKIVDTNKELATTNENITELTQRVYSIESSISTDSEVTVGFPDYNSPDTIMNFDNFQEDSITQTHVTSYPCWLLISVTSNGNDAMVEVNNNVIIRNNIKGTTKQIMIPVFTATNITGTCGAFLDSESAKVEITAYPFLVQ